MATIYAEVAVNPLCRRCVAHPVTSDPILCERCLVVWPMAKVKRTYLPSGSTDRIVGATRRCGQCDGPVWTDEDYLCEYHARAAD